MTTQSARSRLRAITVAMIAGIVLLPGAAWAIPVDWKADPKFPDFFQKDPKVTNGLCACAPVAATDSMFWLAKKYNLPKLATLGGKTWQDVTNTLEGAKYMNTKPGPGTFSGSFASGKTAYIKAAGYADKVKVETKLGGSGAPPTLDWIKMQVAAGQDVEILIGAITDAATGAASWDGGHYVAVTGYTDDKSLSIADPWTDNNNNAEALNINGTGKTTLNFDSNGNAKADYTQDYLRVDLQDGLFKDSKYYIVFAAFAESPVPEPISLAFFAAGLIGAAALRRRAQNRRTAAV